MGHAQNPADDQSAAPANVDAIESQLATEIEMGPSRPKMVNKTFKPPENFTDLADLATRSKSEVVAIQKNQMPKTGRFLGSVGGAWLMNDPFFFNLGLEARGSYFFDEGLGLEILGSTLNSSSTYKVKDLNDKQGLSVASLVTPSHFLGLDVIFNSIYGKWAVRNRTISALDLYQTLGFGKMTTTSGASADAVFAGVGQMTSMSRNSYWRMDLSYYLYRTQNIQGNFQSANSIFLTLSWGAVRPSVGLRE